MTKKLKRNDLQDSVKSNLVKSIRKDPALYLILLIPFIYYIIFKYEPMLGNIIAFRKFRPGGSIFGYKWVGLRYFKIFITDQKFWEVFRNTVVLSGLILVLSWPVPIIFALLLNEIHSVKFKKSVQVISYLPHFLSLVVVYGLLQKILSPSSGIINDILRSLGRDPVHFLLEPRWFRPVYIISDIWQNTGWGAIIYLAALTSIDPQLYESSEIDGASRFQQTLFITLPGLLPTITVLLILKIGRILTLSFQKILLLYNPMTYPVADVIQTYVYRMGLLQNNYSYATAIGLFESVIGLFLVITANKIARKVSDTSLW
jgi:putative aldouronate transport system permease protein